MQLDSTSHSGGQENQLRRSCRVGCNNLPWLTSPITPLQFTVSSWRLLHPGNAQPMPAGQEPAAREGHTARATRPARSRSLPAGSPQSASA